MAREDDLDPAVKRSLEAMDHAEDMHLPPLEFYVAGNAAGAAMDGVSENDFIYSLHYLSDKPTALDAPNIDMPDRLSQLIANLKHFGLWPW